MMRRLLLMALFNATPLVSLDAAAQRTEHYAVRLAPTPRDTSMRATIAGHGAVEVTLDGRTLTVSGRFEGLKSPATAAHVNRGHAVGVRGPAVYDLDLERSSAGGTAGTITGRIELDPAMLEALDAGRLYIQVDSQAVPDGNLWGWIYEDATR